MNIFKRELRANRKALIIWSVCMFLLIAAGMSKYTAYSAGSGSTNDIFNAMPYTVRALLGIGSFDVTVMSGYFALLFLYIELTVGVHAVLLGTGIIAKEERDKTTEFLMIKPVSRKEIVSAKFYAALVNLIIINLVSLVSSIMMVSAYNKGADITGEILVFHLSLFLFQLVFMAVGALISAFMKNPKAAGSLGTGILMVSFAVAKITDLTDKVNFLNVLSPFKYFDYAKIVNGNGLDMLIVVLSVLFVAICVGLTYYFYQKRDLKV